VERRWIVAGERVGLTALVKEEFLDRWDAYNDAEMGMLISYPTAAASATSPTKPPVTREHREALWELVVSRAIVGFDVRTVEDRRFIGECSLSRIAWPRACGEIAMAIFDPEDRGRGYGTEAVTLLVAYGFDGLGLHRVTMRYLAINGAVVQAVERQAESAGGRIVGIERESEWAFGGWQDTVLLEVLRDDFPPHPATAHLRHASERVDVPG
jgi:RimJ/RimL family protein N-acetyltransferase